MTTDPEQRVHAAAWSAGALVLAACLVGGALGDGPEPVPLSALGAGLAAASALAVQTWRGRITWTPRTGATTGWRSRPW